MERPTWEPAFVAKVLQLRDTAAQIQVRLQDWKWATMPPVKLSYLDSFPTPDSGSQVPASTPPQSTFRESTPKSSSMSTPHESTPHESMSKSTLRESTSPTKANAQARARSTSMPSAQACLVPKSPTQPPEGTEEELGSGRCPSTTAARGTPRGARIVVTLPHSPQTPLAVMFHVLSVHSRLS